MITQSTLEEIENKEGYLYGIISSEIQIYLGISDKPLNPSTGLTTFQLLSTNDKNTRLTVVKKQVTKNNNTKLYKQYQLFINNQPVKIVPEKQVNVLLSEYIVVNLKCLNILGTPVGYEYLIDTYKLGNEHKLIEKIKQIYISRQAQLKNMINSQMIFKPIQYPVSLIIYPKQFAENKFTQITQPLGTKSFKFIFNIQKIKDSKELNVLFNGAIEGLLKTSNQIPSFLTEMVQRIPSKIWNPHLFLTTPSLFMHQRFMFKGNYEFYHYGDQSFNDNGWGCAYRAFQSLLSWFVMGNYSQAIIPSIPNIQKKLFQIDKSQNRINSTEWIGANQVAWLVTSYVGLDCKIVYLQDGQNIMQKVDIFKHHFETMGTPIMYGGGQYAYTILGINYSWKLGQCQFLILDPHYTLNDDIKSIVDKEGISWKDKSKLFKKGVYYNFCLPQLKNKKVVSQQSKLL